MPIINTNRNGMDIPLILSMAMAQNPSALPMFEALDNDTLKTIAGISDKSQADIHGRINGLYSAADTLGRARMF